MESPTDGPKSGSSCETSRVLIGTANADHLVLQQGASHTPQQGRDLQFTVCTEIMNKELETTIFSMKDTQDGKMI